MKIRALVAASAVLMSGFGMASATAATTSNSPYQVTKNDPDRTYVQYRQRPAHFREAVNIKQARFGRNDATQMAYASVKVHEILTAAKIRNKAPFMEQQIMLELSKDTADGSTFGFELGSIVIDRNGTRIVRTVEQYNSSCEISMSYDRKYDTFTVAAPYSCGLPDDPSGEPLHFSASAFMNVREGAPRNTQPSSDFVQATLR